MQNYAHNFPVIKLRIKNCGMSSREFIAHFLY